MKSLSVIFEYGGFSDSPSVTLLVYARGRQCKKSDKALYEYIVLLC